MCHNLPSFCPSRGLLHVAVSVRGVEFLGRDGVKVKKGYVDDSCLHDRRAASRQFWRLQRATEAGWGREGEIPGFRFRLHAPQPVALPARVVDTSTFSLARSSDAMYIGCKHAPGDSYFTPRIYDTAATRHSLHAVSTLVAQMTPLIIVLLTPQIIVLREARYISWCRYSTELYTTCFFFPTTSCLVCLSNRMDHMAISPPKSRK